MHVVCVIVTLKMKKKKLDYIQDTAKKDMKNKIVDNILQMVAAVFIWFSFCLLC